MYKQKIMGYFRHVDDILIMHNRKLGGINHTLQEFNNTHIQNLKFTIEKETKQQNKFLSHHDTNNNEQPHL